MLIMAEFASRRFLAGISDIRRFETGTYERTLKWNGDCPRATRGVRSYAQGVSHEHANILKSVAGLDLGSAPSFASADDDNREQGYI